MREEAKASSLRYIFKFCDWLLGECIMSDKFMAEPDYLTKFAVDAYNAKYGKSVDPKLCNIWSIRKTYGYEHAYNIDTLQGGDFVQLRLYFNPGKISTVFNIRLESKQNQAAFNKLGDEVFAITAEIYNYDYVYHFSHIAKDVTQFGLFQLMSGDYLTRHDGTPMKPMRDET